VKKTNASLYRVEFVLPITNERQLWSNYLNLRDAVIGHPLCSAEHNKCYVQFGIMLS